MVEIECKSTISWVFEVTSPNAVSVRNLAEGPTHVLEDHEYAMARAVDSDMIAHAAVVVVEGESSIGWIFEIVATDAPTRLVINLFEHLIRAGIIDDTGKDCECALARAVDGEMVETPAVVVVKREHLICGIRQIKSLDSILNTSAEIDEEWVGRDADFHSDGFGGCWYLSDGNECVLVVVGFAARVRDKREGGVVGPARVRIAFVTLVFLPLQVHASVGLDKSHLVWSSLVVNLALNDMPNCSRI